VIARLRFASRPPRVSAAEFAAAWRCAVATAAGAPDSARPARAVVCTVVPELAGPDPKHDSVAIEWFADAARLRRFDHWRGGVEVPAAANGGVVVAAPQVLRGARWLTDRWHAGGPALKHMALAVRAHGLGKAEFAARWRAHAGTVATANSAAAVVIPDSARGRAYVQNHPVPDDTGPYDAVNEVYLADLAELRARMDWFAANPVEPAAGLFGRSWFLPVREEIVLG
jgi:hypothetical protein